MSVGDDFHGSEAAAERQRIHAPRHPGNIRCGHNFTLGECPYEVCGYREMAERLRVRTALLREYVTKEMAACDPSWQATPDICNCYPCRVAAELAHEPTEGAT